MDDDVRSKFKQKASCACMSMGVPRLRPVNFWECCESLGMQSGHMMYRTDGMCCQLLNVAGIGIYPGDVGI